MLFQAQVNSTVPTARATGQPNAALDMLGNVAVSEILGRYSNLVQSGQVFMAAGTITAPVIYSTAAGTGGPLLWNGTSTKSAHILAVGVGALTTAATAAGTLGLTGNTGQTAAPTTTTAITTTGNCLIGGPASGCSVFNIGTVTNPGNRFLGFANVTTAATTAPASSVAWFDVGGLVVAPPNAWCSIAGSVTLTAGVFNMLTLVWAELPV